MKNTLQSLCCLTLAACTAPTPGGLAKGDTVTTDASAAAAPDGGAAGDGDAGETPDAGVAASRDAGAALDAGTAITGTGTVADVRDLRACPAGAPSGATCKQVTVRGCPQIEDEAIDATIMILLAAAPARGTITHFKGGGGEGFLTTGTDEYRAEGFDQIFVSWASDWEQTAGSGIKTAACRPATILRWVFEDPTLHGGSRARAFCAEGKSGGSAQIGYALTHYGLADALDYVNELSGPPFARIDLGCDGDAPATATVCGQTVTMRLPAKVGAWENMAPLTCGSTDVPSSDLERWRDDSIAFGGTYDYPNTRVEFFDCTNMSTAVTAMAQLYYQQITSDTAYHCYSQADGCRGEGLGTGERVAIQAMIDGCTPRHR